MSTFYSREVEEIPSSLSAVVQSSCRNNDLHINNTRSRFDEGNQTAKRNKCDILSNTKVTNCHQNALDTEDVSADKQCDMDSDSHLYNCNTRKDGASGDEASSSSSTPYWTAEEDPMDEDSVQGTNSSVTDDETELENTTVDCENGADDVIKASNQMDSAGDEIMAERAKRNRANSFMRDNDPISVQELQSVLDCFKSLEDFSVSECENLLDLLAISQNRNDFQWALHQLGGFNAFLFLYARVVEICSDDEVQSKSLSLILGQLKSHSKITDAPSKCQYNLLRFVLNSSKSVFGFKTFLSLINHCLTPSGHKLLDYDLLDVCLLSSWRKLVSTRCQENDAPTGRRCLLECLLTVILDLLVEQNPHRDSNVSVLKSEKFTEKLLAICVNIIVDVQMEPLSSSRAGGGSLDLMDALRISSLVKSIICELMAPPDAFVIESVIKFGLYPLLSHDLPPLPCREDAYFVFHKDPSYNNSLTSTMEESSRVLQTNNTNVIKTNENAFNPPASSTSSILKVSQFQDPEDIPELVNATANEKSYDKETFERQQLGSFRENFQESLIETVMSILLNSLAILPDAAFHSVVTTCLSHHVLVAYCSHPSVIVKNLALKLLSAYLSRVQNSCLAAFLKTKGFTLTSLYLQKNTELAHLVSSICNGFGPVSYSLIVSLLHCNSVVNAVIDWSEQDEAGVVPALLSMGFLPSVLNLYQSSLTITRSLSHLLAIVIRFCVLNPKDDPWNNLFCPALECASQESRLTGRIYQESIEYLRCSNLKDLRKADTVTRLFWLLDRATASYFGPHFDTWFLNTFISRIMELDSTIEEETELWSYFVKKNRKRLSFLFGVFLCRVFSPGAGDIEFQKNAVTALLSSPHLNKWLPRVIKSDEHVERIFTAFIRIYLCSSDPSPQNRNGTENTTISGGSFQSLTSHENTNEVMTVHVNNSRNSFDDIYQTEKNLRAMFENCLVDCGIISPTNCFRTFSADFKHFKVMLDSPPISGVSAIEFRQCVALLNKIRFGLHKNLNESIAIMKQNAVAAKHNYANAAYFDFVFDSVVSYAVEVVENVTRTRTNQEVQAAKKICTLKDDLSAKTKWLSLMEQMVHPKAPWHFPQFHAKHWSLDQTEGPGRIRMRLRKCQLNIRSRFLLLKNSEAQKQSPPLNYLFSDDSEENWSFPIIQSDVQYMRLCTKIIPGEEISGEMIASKQSFHFVAEQGNFLSESIDIPIENIDYVVRRRYTLENKAVEIFIDNTSHFFVFRSQKDRDEFLQLLHISKSGGYTVHSAVLETSLPSMTAQWVKGQLSNFEYLMFLNTAAGRTYCDLMQYPVFPFVLAKYDNPTLDLHAPQSYRDLRKPIAIQDHSKEQHFISTYNYLKRECDSAPFHYGSHYSNSGIVLHFLVRLPPYTQQFLKYQDGNFDIPDRSFHSVDTTWRLASKESNTDFKEAIPEFYYLPEFLKNLQGFDLGIRQNGSRVHDVVLPPWAKGDARLFTLINRQALESNQVRKFLNDWIDLIFGFKQTGKASIQAINVFHPSTYEGFEVDGIGDELLRRARKAMVSTYGQTPKKLFSFPHSRSSISYIEPCDVEVLDTVWGVRWGQFLGSPSCPELQVTSTRQFHESISLFERNSRVVFWPDNTLIMGDAVVGTWDTSAIHIKSVAIYICIGDEITCCETTDDSIWVGLQSGRIVVLKLSASFDKVVETYTLVGHYQPIKNIDLNQEFSTAVTCSGEEYIILWDMNKKTFINAIDMDCSIDRVHSSKSTGDIVLLQKEKNQFTLITINGFIVGSIQFEDEFQSVCITALDPGRNVNAVAVGCDFGKVRFYSTWDLKFINEIKVLPLASLPIQSIRYSRDGRRLYCLSRAQETSITVALQLPDIMKH